MNRDIVDGRMERELRRRHLAVRLINHQARTHRIEELTGLTRHQLATLRRRAGVSADSRLRGPAPTSFEVFFSSARTRNESAVLGLLYCALGVSKFSKRNGSSDAAIECGERLCDVFETWRHLFPASRIEFEQLVLLGGGITRGDKISFGYCGSCRAILLVDRFGTQRKLCDYCAHPRRDDPGELPHSGGHLDQEESDLAIYGLQLLGGHLLRERKGRYTFKDEHPESE